MNSTELMRFREQLDEIRENLGTIKKQAVHLNTLLDSDKLIPEEVTRKLIDTLAEYQEKSALLQKTGKEISLSLSDNLLEIELELKKAEEREISAAELSLLLDYFRLTSEAEDVKEKLEVSKEKLSQRLRDNADVTSPEYHPYKLTVKKVSETGSTISKEEFRELMDGIGFELAWALNESTDNLRIDSQIDIGSYTAGIDLGEPVAKGDNKQEVEAAVEDLPPADPAQEERNGVPKDANPVLNDQVENQSSLPNAVAGCEETTERLTDTSSTNPLWKDFDGYVNDVNVSFTNVSASTLGASKFIGAVKSKYSIPFALYIVAHQKLVDVSSADCGRSAFNDIPEDVINYLLKQEYLMPVEVSKGEESHSYLMLTSKGWAVYKKAEIVKFLKSSKQNTFVPEFIRMTTDGYSAKNIIKMIRIRDYYAFWSKAEEPIYVLFPETASQPIFAYSGDEKDKMLPAIVPAVFEKGSEKEDLERIISLINNWDSKTDIHIIADSSNDINLLTAELYSAVASDKQDHVFFCTKNDPNTLYDWNGQLVDVEKTQQALDDWGNNDENEETSAAEDPSKPVVEVKAEEPAAQVVAVNTKYDEQASRSQEVTVSENERNRIFACTEEMLADNKLYCASAYLAAAAKSYPYFSSAYSSLAYAVNDPICKPKYSSENINQSFFSGAETVPDSWLVSAVLRNFFLDHSQYDYEIQGLYDTVKELDLFAISPKLKNILRTLMEFKRKNGHGLDYYADYRTSGAASYEANQRDLQKEARLLYESHVEGVTRERANNERFIETKKYIFSRDGYLAEMLMLVANLKQSEASFIKEYLQTTFLKDGSEFSISNLDADKIDAVVDEAWEVAQGKLFYKRSNIKLVGGLRQNLIMKIRACVEVLCRFVELCEASKIDEHDAGAIGYKRIRKDLLSDLDSSISELRVFDAVDVKEKADRNIILFALIEIREKIDGTYQEEERKYFYLPFLRNEHVLLNENYLPELIDVEGLPEMSALACIERHFRTPQMELVEYLEKILHGEDDYGSLSLIRQYLEQHPGEDQAYVVELLTTVEEGKEYALKAFVQRKKDFEEYLELAQSYGQINSTVEDKKETMLQSAGVWYEYANETENYGFFCKVIEAFKSKIKEDAKIRAVELEKNLLAFKSANKDWDADPAVNEAVKRIEERIQFQNYSAAEDLLNRLQAHDLEENIPYFSKDYLEDFLNEYNDTASLARTTGAFKISLSDRTREGKAGTTLLQRWPKGFGTQADTIKDLLVTLGFNEPQVNVLKQVDRMDNFTVTLKKPINGRKANYTHPISIFGSEAEENGFRVVCAFGRRQPEELIDSFKAIGSAKNTLMFLDYALTLPERRTLARLTKKEFTGKTFVVVDRVVIAYLAKHYSFTAINRMLMSIVVPFSYYQPYVAESSKVMPPEIFMGRKTELERIEAADGVNIVYGGRQLGKSALLRMAQKDINWNENGDRAVLIDIKGLDYRETARKIAAELTDQYVLDTEIAADKADDWNELGRAIKKVLRDGNEKGRIPYFLLLLDEADAFIESCAQINYQPFDVLKDIQSVGTGRFKFVVAGLRNVVRFNRDAALSNNSVLTHLSSLTVTPFKATDARELLQVPLHYLGFRFQDDSKTDMLISNIFGTTNYFPGLLQLYCTKLIEAMRHDYAGYDEADTPPYMIREEHIKKVLADKTLEDQIREKFLITLKVDDDDYYYQLALLVAFHFHNMKTQSGCSPQNILDLANDYGLSKICALTVEEVSALMEELRELNVLQRVGNGNYRFTRLSFCEMMGLPSDIDDKMMAYAMEG